MHRNTSTLLAFMRDQYGRGRRAARAREILYGRQALKRFALHAIRRLPSLIDVGFQATPVRDLPKMLWGLPWLPVGAIAYSLGAATVTRKAAPIPVEVAPSPNRLLCVLQFRNERRFLPGFLENVAPHVDGIVALDDGSTDGSGEIVAAHPAVREVLRIEPSEPTTKRA